MTAPERWEIFRRDASKRKARGNTLRLDLESTGMGEDSQNRKDPIHQSLMRMLYDNGPKMPNIKCQ